MTLFGIITTVLYVALVVFLRWSSLPELHTMPLNEFGDFFAGVFGPLMLFWLILGYVQQQVELRQNTKALELQSDELRKSVDQHRDLVKATKLQVETERKSLEMETAKALKETQPAFSIVAAGAASKQAIKVAYRIILENKGQTASGVVVKTEPNIKQINARKMLPYLGAGGSMELVWDTAESGGAPERLKLMITCKDARAQDYAETFEFRLDDELQYHVESVS